MFGVAPCELHKEHELYLRFLFATHYTKGSNEQLVAFATSFFRRIALMIYAFFCALSY